MVGNYWVALSMHFGTASSKSKVSRTIPEIVSGVAIETIFIFLILTAWFLIPLVWTTYLHPARVLSTLPWLLQDQVDRQRNNVVYAGDRLDRVNWEQHPEAVHSGRCNKKWKLVANWWCKFLDYYPIWFSSHTYYVYAPLQPTNHPPNQSRCSSVENQKPTDISTCCCHS